MRSLPCVLLGLLWEGQGETQSKNKEIKAERSNTCDLVLTRLTQENHNFKTSLIPCLKMPTAGDRQPTTVSMCPSNHRENLMDD